MTETNPTPTKITVPTRTEAMIERTRRQWCFSTSRRANRPATRGATIGKLQKELSELGQKVADAVNQQGGGPEVKPPEGPQDKPGEGPGGAP